MRWGIAVYLVATLAVSMSSTAQADRVDYAAHPDRNVANQPNRGHLAHYKNRRAASAKTARARSISAPDPIPADVVSIVVFRGDGGDPRGLRIDDPANFIYAVSGIGGEDHVYQNGREVRINPMLRKGVKQIALSERGALDTALPAATFPPSLAAVLSQFGTNGVAPREVRVHIVTRQDTARVADAQAREMLALEAQAQVALAHGQMRELVKMVMRNYGLKSDACDNSRDERCDRPGVREAFAEIKREEAGQL